MSFWPSNFIWFGKIFHNCCAKSAKGLLFGLALHFRFLPIDGVVPVFGQSVKVLLFGLALHFRVLPIDGVVPVVWPEC
jgi:hypothetical protein